MTVVDCHAHIFPPLSGPCGYETAAEHLLYQQFSMHLHGNQPVRRLRDHQIVDEKHLWDPADPSESGRAAVDFRVGRCGRFEWDLADDSYYIQFLPPVMTDMSCPADMLIAQMDYAGIDVAVLHNDHIYGSLSALFATAAERYPGRFIGLAGIDEAFAYRDEQIRSLHDACDRLDMAGLYFTTSGFFRDGYRTWYTDDVFGDFWREVRALQLPVFWVHYGDSPAGTYDDELRRFRNWLHDFGDIPSVLVHGVPTFLYADEGDVVRLPDPIRETLRHPNVYAELLYPITCGGRMDYPFPRAAEHIRQLCDTIGAERLLWGSDMPNVERYCTYRQSLTYLTRYCDFIAADDLNRILGANTLSLFAKGA